MKKCINEFAMVKTENDYILCAEYDDGSVDVTYERHKIAPNRIEIIQHRNRDVAGKYYTTRKSVDSCICSTDTQTEEEWWRKHLFMLAKVEEQRRTDGTYANANKSFKQNSVNRIKKYISNRTVEERGMKEYQLFIDSMEKSIAMLSC